MILNFCRWTLGWHQDHMQLKLQVYILYSFCITVSTFSCLAGYPSN
jgi:hypothetical protein